MMGGVLCMSGVGKWVWCFDGWGSGRYPEMDKKRNPGGLVLR